tara:strand:+ start:1028 stop:1948 length:921 start_codon:yes stop_codon:yes gene_type:complete
MNTENLLRKKYDENIFTDELLTVSYWENLVPQLNIEKLSYNQILDISKNSVLKLKKNLIKYGYFHKKDKSFDLPLSIMEGSIKVIDDIGLPPVFAFVFDEFWYIQFQIKNILDEMLGKDYKQLPDFWAWHINCGQSGWQPHRDKNEGSLFENNEPKSVTVWIPLSHASPTNSCMYVLPANKDKFYNTLASEKNPLELPGSLSDIKALPASSGDLLIWTQEIFHWGSSSTDKHDESARTSIAFEFQRNDVPPFRDFLLEPGVLPTFDERLALISMQILQYTHAYGFKENLVNWAHRYVEIYRKKNNL